jgi:hypothetical protein
MKTIIIVLASKRHTVVSISTLPISSINLARLRARELLIVAVFSTDGDTDLFLIAPELILNVAPLRVAAYIIVINA